MRRRSFFYGQAMQIGIFSVVIVERETEKKEWVLEKLFLFSFSHLEALAQST